MNRPYLPLGAQAAPWWAVDALSSPGPLFFFGLFLGFGAVWVGGLGVRAAPPYRSIGQIAAWVIVRGALTGLLFAGLSAIFAAVSVVAPLPLLAATAAVGTCAVATAIVEASAVRYRRSMQRDALAGIATVGVVLLLSDIVAINVAYSRGMWSTGTLAGALASAKQAVTHLRFAPCQGALLAATCSLLVFARLRGMRPPAQCAVVVLGVCALVLALNVRTPFVTVATGGDPLLLRPPVSWASARNAAQMRAAQQTLHAIGAIALLVAGFAVDTSWRRKRILAL